MSVLNSDKLLYTSHSLPLWTAVTVFRCRSDLYEVYPKLLDSSLSSLSSEFILYGRMAGPLAHIAPILRQCGCCKFMRALFLIEAHLRTCAYVSSTCYACATPCTTVGFSDRSRHTIIQWQDIQWLFHRECTKRLLDHNNNYHSVLGCSSRLSPPAAVAKSVEVSPSVLPPSPSPAPPLLPSPPFLPSFLALLPFLFPGGLLGFLWGWQRT